MSSVASCHLRLPEPGLRLGPVDSALSRYNVKPGTSTTVVVATLFVVCGVELASHSVSNETLLLKFGALPEDGELHGEYWRLATYSFLHLNGTHLLVDAMLLFWVGRIIESRAIFVSAGAIYVFSVLCSAAMILFVQRAT
jgi:rhomboid protease GluP